MVCVVRAVRVALSNGGLVLPVCLEAVVGGGVFFFSWITFLGWQLWAASTIYEGKFALKKMSKSGKCQCENEEQQLMHHLSCCFPVTGLPGMWNHLPFLSLLCNLCHCPQPVLGQGEAGISFACQEKYCDKRLAVVKHSLLYLIGNP